MKNKFEENELEFIHQASEVLVVILTFILFFSLINSEVDIVESFKSSIEMYIVSTVAIDIFLKVVSTF